MVYRCKPGLSKWYFNFPLNNRHYYVVLIMDIYSRKIVGYSVADNMRAENINALQMALTWRGIKNYKNKLIHHSDRGSQYVSYDYTNLLEDYGIGISMCKDVLENAHSERANGTIKNEYLNRWVIRTFEDLKIKMKQAVNNYNDILHWSIKNTQPAWNKIKRNTNRKQSENRDIYHKTNKRKFSTNAII